MLDLFMTNVRLVYDQVVSKEVLAGTKIPRGMLEVMGGGGGAIHNVIVRLVYDQC